MTVSEDCKVINDWMREPDYAENFSLDNMADWLNRRPIAEVARLTAALSDQVVVRPLAEWHEDDGAVLWWKFPVQEPPYCGTPIDCPRVYEIKVNDCKMGEHLVGGWPGYHTHFTPIPLPAPPPSSTAGEGK